MTDPFQTFDPEADEQPTPYMDPAAQEAAPPPKLADQPNRIGRYRLDKVLGEGGFGTVYLAHDEQLNRAVAVKVPRRKRTARPEDAKAFLEEARVLASLDHPNIVPVYDADITPDGAQYVVSKVIDGSDLAKLIASSRPNQNQTAELVASIASALHYAHRKGLVHRDVKPGNILLDREGNCFVADFGLALKDEDYGKGNTFAGTPAYMSPEQARSEGHRVDGRSDIFSLGIILYEMLVGRRPFKGDSLKNLLDAIANADPRPPRQINDGISKELERICLKALAKRVADRYTTAKDMAEDLRAYVAQVSQNVPLAAGDSAATFGHGSVSANATATPLGGSTQGSPQRHSETLEIVPRGLRSFDAEDADTFLDLLPGARDRRGLPDSVGFWKTRIEEHDPEATFSIGLVYGPSGCGKTSLVKAGLLPRLSSDVMVIYVEATASETETRILNGLRKKLADLPNEASLKDAMSMIRQGQLTPPGRKILVIVDQFEQWLHGQHGEDSELAQSLRQCDGGRLQCLLMVRDDFWMSVTRFLGEVEIELIQGTNFAAVDLFDLRHAEKVLAAFGRAFGALPANAAETTAEQKEFLTQAIAGLSQDSKVICVRLALFADMMKGKPWTPATLKDVGGTAGLGVTFLEESFASPSANPRHRYHQKAVRAALGSLLPELGTNIKGAMRSRDDLMRVSGYAKPKEFDELLRILDGEIRLITPTDREGRDIESTVTHVDGVDSKDESKSETTYYQLTHDYLVPPLREWLTSKQKETRRGRAELLLADQAGVWSVRPVNRQLPSLLQWLRIRCLTRKSAWTAVQRKMMRKAARLHAIRTTVVLLLLIGAAVAGFQIRKSVAERHDSLRAEALVKRLLDAEITQAPGIVDEMKDFRSRTDPLLEKAKSDPSATPRQALHASLALLVVDPSQKEYLYERLLTAAPREVGVIRDALAPHKAEALDRLWAAAISPPKGREPQRLRAAAALAAYVPADSRWQSIAGPLVDQLAAENPMFLGVWMDAFRPVRAVLATPLAVAAADPRRRESERMVATSIFADYAAHDAKLLAEAILGADEKQFAILLPAVKQHTSAGLPLLHAELAVKVAEPREVFKKEATIDAKDPPVVIATGESRPAKVFDVPLQAGRVYRIAMTSKFLDSYLVIQNKAGERVAFDDDSGGKSNALLAFAPPTDGAYKVFAAAYEKTGPFTLTVTEIAGDDVKERLAKRQANAALSLMRLGHAVAVWKLFEHAPDPRLRSRLIHRVASFGIDPAALLRLDDKTDVSARRAFVLALGTYPESMLSADDRAGAIEKLEAIYESADDAGLHAAAEWTLRQWKQTAWLKKTDDVWAADTSRREKRLAGLYELLSKGKATPTWYVDGQGQTLIVIPGPVAFSMGSPVTEPKRQPNEFPHKKRIGRTFAISAKPVTVGEFRRFDKGYTFDESRAPTADCPVIQTSWHHAALYCNWLSEQEGIAPEQWCYELAPDKKAVVKLKPNYLSLSGYRLPTEAELEYAIRAGATTSRFFGESDELLGHYAWYGANANDRTWPVGSKMPNDLGLFDAHGNVWCWCLDAVTKYPEGQSVKDAGFGDRESLPTVNADKNRILRGGAFDDQAPYLRSAYRNSNGPTLRLPSYGFRVARTIAAE